MYALRIILLLGVNIRNVKCSNLVKKIVKTPVALTSVDLTTYQVENYPFCDTSYTISSCALK